MTRHMSVDARTGKAVRFFRCDNCGLDMYAETGTPRGWLSYESSRRRLELCSECADKFAHDIKSFLKG